MIFLAWDVADRLCAKGMIFVTGDDVQFECLANQICSGIKSGIEGSIHTFRSLYEKLSVERNSLLLMNACNALKSKSHMTAIWNTRIFWSCCSKYSWVMLSFLFLDPK